MFEINYTFSSLYKLDDIDYRLVTEVEMRYKLFLGSLVLKTNSSMIKLDWDWIPLLDFALHFLSLSLEFIGKDILIKTFEFTESDGLLLIDKNFDMISLSTSYSNEKIEINFTEFSETVMSFYISLTKNITNEYPEILFNTEYQNIKIDNKI